MEINFAQTYKKKAECKKQRRKNEGRKQKAKGGRPIPKHSLYSHPFLKKPDDKLTKT
jgi:hypothetical protein